jgi:hypothetical protein
MQINGTYFYALTKRQWHLLSRLQPDELVFEPRHFLLGFRQRERPVEATALLLPVVGLILTFINDEIVERRLSGHIGADVALVITLCYNVRVVPLHRITPAGYHR